jgi:hypothetical protein
MSNFRSRRLQSANDALRLMEILNDLESEPEAVVAVGALAELPKAHINRQAKTGDAAWQALVILADQTSNLESLLDTVLQKYEGYDAATDLRRWLGSTGVTDVELLVRHVSHWLDIVTTTSPPSLAEPTDALAVWLKDLAKALARPDAWKAVIGVVSNPEEKIQSALTAIRRAVAAVDSLLYQARDAASFLSEPASIDHREEASRRIANYGLIDHVLRQRAVAEQSVATLLEILRAMIPAAFVPIPATDS